MLLSALIQKLIGTIPMPLIGSREQFVNYLKLAHGTMRASAPLLELAVAKAEGELRDYYRSHLEEERDHADWLAADLRVLGEGPPRLDHAAAAIAGAQYYYLNHVGAHMLLGYMAAMEFRPMPMATVDKLASIFGEDAIRTLRHHALHDPQHSEVLARVINRHEDQGDGIAYNAFVTTKMLAHYLSERMGHGATL
jgi:hypothetical protein